MTQFLVGLNSSPFFCLFFVETIKVQFLAIKDNVSQVWDEKIAQKRILYDICNMKNYTVKKLTFVG